MIPSFPTSVGSVGRAAQRDRSAREAKGLRQLFIIGDSTVRIVEPDNPQRGWGQELAPHFDADRITLQNHAIGGRSSRTFRTEGRWQAVLDQATRGDFVVMQFGHNDANAPDDPQRPRGTLPGIGNETLDIIHPETRQPERVHTFGWYMRQYVREAKAAGMIPVVCSSVPHCPRPVAHATDPDLTRYRLWAQQVAEREGVAFLDLYRRISHAYAMLAPEQVKARYFMDGDDDYTHTSGAGAAMNARVVADGVRDLQGDAGRLGMYLLAPHPPGEQDRGGDALGVATA